MGYKLDFVANGVQVFAALNCRFYDIILMDVQMPEMDGMEATRTIRERQRTHLNPNYKSAIIIVAMTANAMNGDREKCLAAGMDDYLPKPVRPEDIRGVIERWAAAATAEPTPKPTVSQTETATGAFETKSNPPTTGGTRPPPVEMERLHDFTNGNPEDLRELINLYLKQTSDQVAQLLAAVRSGSAPDVRRLAHSCAGASATCGMSAILPPLRELEHQGEAGKLLNAPELASQVEAEFNRIRIFLETYLAQQTKLTAAH